MGLFRAAAATMAMLSLALASASNNIRAAYPQVVSVKTTRGVASEYGSYFDVLKGNSRRLKDEGDGEMLELSVMLHGDEQVKALQDLENEGLLSFEKNHDLTHRQLQGISKNLTCYRKIHEVFDTIDNLVEEYPGFVTVKDIGKSWKNTQGAGGFPIKVFILSAPDTDVEKVDMMIMGGHHSRELPPPETLMRWAEKLLDSYGTDADITWILNRTNIHIVPISNPDGRAYVQYHLDWRYRKNAHPYGCEEGIARDGVDLNRNWPMFWGQDIGSSNDTCATSFRGGAPLSEPETNALYDYFKSLFPEEVSKGTPEEAMEKLDEMCPEDTPGLFIDVHSSGDFIYFPWGIEDRLSPNHLPLLTMTAKLSKPGNYDLWGPGQDGFLYFVSGDATDTTYGIECIASFGYEIGSEWYEPCDLLENVTIPIVHESLLYAAKTVAAPYRIPLGPDVLSIGTNKSTTMLELTVEVSDVEMIVSKAVFPSEEAKSQNIAEVRVYVDTHPYDLDDASTAMKMTASDGAFDNSTETAMLDLDMTEWADGQHTVYIEAVDTDGNAGAISAIFVIKGEPTDGGSGDGISGDDTDPPSASAFVALSSAVLGMLSVAAAFLTL